MSDQNPIISIAVVVGSLRRDSHNRKLAHALTQLAPDDFSCSQVEIADLPLYNQDDDGQPHACVLRLKSQIRSAQGLLFVTPEYNRSVSGVLKNALDHASRPYGQSVWDGKPAGVIGMSIGVAGPLAAQQHLRNILAYLNVPTLGQPEAFLQAKPGFFDDDGRIGVASLAFVQGWMDQFAAWVRQHNRVGGVSSASSTA